MSKSEEGLVPKSGNHSNSGLSPEEQTGEAILKSLSLINGVLASGKTIDDTLTEISQIIPLGFRLPAAARCRICYDGKEYFKHHFTQSTILLTIPIKTFDGRIGSIIVSYLDDPSVLPEDAFTAEENLYLTNISQLINGYLNQIRGQAEKQFTNERLKELAAINQTTNIIKAGKSVPETLRIISSILPHAWQYPEFTTVRIQYDTAVFTSMNFLSSQWKIEAPFETIDGKHGVVQVFYLQSFPDAFEGPFLREERDLIDNIANILSGYLNSARGREDRFSSTERLKELSAINQTTAILREKKPIDETFEQIVSILPGAWQYPQFTCVKISIGQKNFTSTGFKETLWKQTQEFETIDGSKGSISVFYTKKFPDIDEGPFMKEERMLIINLANLLVGHLNSIKGRDAMKKVGQVSKKPSKSLINSRQLLQKFLTKNNYNRDVFHDLMPFKVREILLVATLYDAYSIEKEGRFSEHILGEYYQLNLTSLPRITGVSTYEEAMEQLENKHYDLIILMIGVDKQAPFALSKKIRDSYPYIPIYLLLNNNTDIYFLENEPEKSTAIDKVFVWNGDSKVFFAMVKHLEDKVNVENDTKIGLVRIILLVEDSAKYYSRYLPLLYSSVLEQTKRLIEDVNTDELYKVLKLRARPKILLASDYEEAVSIFNNYKDYMLCLITDVKYQRNGVLDEKAGFALVKEVRETMKDLPIIIQSSDASNSHEAFLQKASFLNKNSESLAQDIKFFISTYLGFGSFVYKDEAGRPIATARTLREFEKLLRTIPDDSLFYHARRNHFSLWLMARGEIQIAKIIYPFKLEHFDKPEEIRRFLLEAIQQHRNEQNKGKVIPFEETLIQDETNILTLSSGSLGGKGRGLAFINTLIYNFDFHQLIPNINLRTPKTFAIGTDEFEAFMERNKLYEKVYAENDFEVIKAAFLEARLSEVITTRLRKMLSVIDKPLAIRSSGLFEDSLMQPFAGIFETFLIPNNHTDMAIRLQQCVDAIKLVFASVFTKTARSYIEAINYRIEEERMAVIIQEVVGNKFGNVYYPHISGVAQSYNYYPFAHMKPEEGFGVLALGLGRYVVEGEKAYRFSPTYPNLEINSPRDQLKGSQVHFYAINLNNPTIDLLKRGEEAGLIKLDIDEAEKHGTLKHCASVFNPDNNTITPGLAKAGPRILNFADILKYNYAPIAKTIEIILDVVKEAMGSPVEIEFAVDLNRDANYRSTFYLLQIKPLIGNAQDYNIEPETLDSSKLMLYSEKAMGNGLIDDIIDVIYCDPKTFDKSCTVEMAEEIEQLNTLMAQQNTQYVLIGPGRWGTRDRWIGIPVAWPQISKAKVIVETALEDFPLDASSGSHFFHNVTSMNVGYLSIQHINKTNFIDWNVLAKQPIINETTYFKHVRFANPLSIKMDGKKRIAIMQWDDKTEL